VFPRFWQFLSNGSGTVSYPWLILFLSFIPNNEIGQGTEFIQQFFTNLWKGKQSDAVVKNRNDQLQLVMAFCETHNHFLQKAM
jgi:hypothetical protein